MSQDNKPKLEVSGRNGNSMAILARAKKVCLENDMDFDKIEDEATNGDHDHFMKTMNKYFNIV